MNMQDYRHAADRVHIADRCEEEVLSMTSQTEQKTRKPLLRTVTGIAAAAACVGITGALGLALFRMGKDSEDLLTAASDETENVTAVTEPTGTEPVTEPVQDESSTETYEDFISAYYEKVAGHPVSYDWSSLCGTNLNEVWETADGTVTLKAAVTDGYQAQFFYTFKPNYDWDHTAAEERGKKLPQILFNMTFRSSGDSGPFVSLDDTVREDGTIRFYRYLRASMTAEPIPEDGICIASVGDQTREIKLNMPEQMPQWHALSETLHFVNDGSAWEASVREADYSYAVVTPLCVYLTDLPLAEVFAIYEKAKNCFGGTGMPVYAGSVSAAALTLHGDHISVPLNLVESPDVFYGESAYQFIAEEYQEGRDPEDGKLFGICMLQFKEPQDFSEITGMTFASPADGAAVSVDLTPEKLPFTPELDPDKAEINVVSEPETTAPQETTETTATTADYTKLWAEQDRLHDEIVAKLETLDWSPDTCDGLPEYAWIGLDGVTYQFNLSSRWVWRSTGSGPLREARLTDELMTLLEQYKNQFGLAEIAY